jgi:hypothetical protein
MEQITIEQFGSFLLLVSLFVLLVVFAFYALLAIPRVLWRAVQLLYYRSLSKPMQGARLIEEQKKQTKILMRILGEK